MTALPSDYTNEISALNREILRHQPRDILQFCANFFQRRLESQRAEFLLTQRHPSQPGAVESSFPGGNPFSSSAAPASHPTGTSAMHSVAEEEEHDFASPTASSFPPDARIPSTSARSASEDTFGNFGGFGGFGATSSAGNLSANAPLESFPNNYNMGRRTSVSAESLAPASADDASWRAPTYPKSEEQISRIYAAVSHNFLFAHLEEEQLSQVMGALQERKVPAKDVRVIVQGDTGDYFYVVESGNCDVYISKTGKAEGGPHGLGEKVASSGPGTSFGELALMYNAPRAATVVSTEPSILWQLDRVTFRRILMDSAFQRRRMYEKFLDKVPLLASLTPYERSKIADALETIKYPAGSTIIRQGDVGDKFYLLEQGEAHAVLRGREDQPVKTYHSGDYFGELALLEDKPRAATVLSKSEVKLATLGKDGFQRLLGPVEGIMRRDDPRKLEDSLESSR